MLFRRTTTTARFTGIMPILLISPPDFKGIRHPFRRSRTMLVAVFRCLVCPPLARVVHFNEPWVDLLFWFFHPPPRPPLKGDICGGFGFFLFYSHKGAPGAASEVIVAYGKPHVRHFLPSSFNSEEQYQKTRQENNDCLHGICHRINDGS